MNVPELALHHQRLEQRAAGLRAQIARIQAELAADPVAEHLERERAAVDAARKEVELGLRAQEREAEGRRARLRGRERELMSGRIRNPTELLKLNQEVDHLRASLGEAEDAQLVLMEQQETLDAELSRLGHEVAVARERTAAATPELRSRLERLEAELAQVEAEVTSVWEGLPGDWQRAYRRVRSADPVSEVVDGQCRACRVGVTSSGMQSARRGALVQCENCSRILVVVG